MLQASFKCEMPRLELKSWQTFLAIKRCQRTKIQKVIKLARSSKKSGRRYATTAVKLLKAEWLCELLLKGYVATRTARLRDPNSHFMQSAIPCLPLQLGLHKRRLSYNFSSYVGRTGHIPKNFRSAALSTATQPWWSSALPTQRHNSRGSCKPMPLKRLIAPNTSITAIKPFRSTRTHHGEATEYPTS